MTILILYGKISHEHPNYLFGGKKVKKLTSLTHCNSFFNDLDLYLYWTFYINSLGHDKLAAFFKEVNERNIGKC